MARTLLIATTSFIGLNPDGTNFYARKGETIIWSDNPILGKFSDWFKPVTATFETPGPIEAPIEEATAAPGKKRGA